MLIGVQEFVQYNGRECIDTTVCATQKSEFAVDSQKIVARKYLPIYPQDVSFAITGMTFRTLE